MDKDGPRLFPGRVDRRIHFRIGAGLGAQTEYSAMAMATVIATAIAAG